MTTAAVKNPTAPRPVREILSPNTFSAAVIAIIGYAAEKVFGDKISRTGRGAVGFFTAAVVIYFSQFIIPSYISVSIFGALLASLVIGIVDSFVPTTLR